MAEWLLASLVWCVVAHLGYVLLGRPVNHQPAAWSLLVTLALVSSGLTALTPAVYDLIYEVTGVPNLGSLINRLCTTAAAFAGSTLLLFWKHDRETAYRVARRRWLLGAVFIGAIIVLFSLSETPHVPAGMWAYSYDNLPTVTGAVALWSIAIGVAAVDLTIWAWRLADHMQTQPYVRFGLRVLSTAGVFAVTYTLAVVAHATAALLGIQWDSAVYLFVIRLATAAAILLGIIGFVLPTAAITGAALRRSLRCYQLRHLWGALVDACPEIHATMRKRNRLSDMWLAATIRDELPLYRRTIEIRDGYLTLRPWMDGDAAHQATWHGKAAGLKGTQLRVVAEAAVIAVAIRRRKAGVPAADHGDVGVGAGVDMSGEISWLAKVSRVYSRNPIVDRIVEEMLRRDLAQPPALPTAEFRLYPGRDPTHPTARGIARLKHPAA